MKKLKVFVFSLLKGFGQIMLQGNVITGLLFILAIFYDSFAMGIAGVSCNIIAMLTAKVLKFSDEDIEGGLYGFNASLIGIALVFFFQINVFVIIAMVLGSILSALAMGFAIAKKLPAYTFPFVAVTMIALYVLNASHLAVGAVPDSFADIKEMDDFLVHSHAFGQVIFQGSLFAGVMFFIGVYLSSPIAALYAFISVLVSVFISHLGHENSEMIREGIFSFNAVLCGIAMSGPRAKDGIFVLISVVISTYFDLFLIHNGLTTLTLPFVVAMWCTLPIKWAWNKLFGKLPSLESFTDS